MKRIADLILANLKLRVFLPLLALALATTWYGLFYSVEKFAGMTNGLSFMDMQPMLTPEKMLEQVASFSSETVSFYIGWSIFDYAWPLITFTTMLFICAWLLIFLGEKWQKRFWWFVIPAYTTVIFDWLENIGFRKFVTDGISAMNDAPDTNDNDSYINQGIVGNYGYKFNKE